MATSPDVFWWVMDSVNPKAIWEFPYKTPTDTNYVIWKPLSKMKPNDQKGIY